ncbi:MAG: class I SAM-dependent methyltransferase [Eubacteriaceae bacterium]|nr:class I SAM-dependent methyltransferase [Eubacteriaceae bacterium]
MSESTHPTMMDLLIETHVALERQGPGSSEMTLKALGFVDDNLGTDACILDLACGTGGQTMALAKNTGCDIIGLDINPAFIGAFNDNAKKLSLEGRVRGVVGSMTDIPYQKESFDLIWSEGAIDSIGFENGIGYWSGFLKQGGFLAVTCPSWFSNRRPAQIEKFWGEAVGGLGTVSENISAIDRTGYSFIAAFTLPEKCWTDGYFAPRTAAAEELRTKYPGNKTVETYIEEDKYEVELFSKHQQHYGYVFYIGRKM